MTREYLDEKLLRIRQQKADVAMEEATEVIIAKEIADQNITDGQALIFGESVSFVSRKFLDNRLEIILPQNWSDFPEELVKLKYPYQARPPIILTDPTTAINFTINHTVNLLRQDEEEIAGFARDMITMTNKATKARFLEDGIVEINGLWVAWYDFFVPSLGEDIYNFVFCTSLENRALILSFNCLEKQKDRWKSVALEIMQTIKIAGREIE
jgi:hypothetical protein